MKDNEILQFGGPIPAAHTFEGLYVDDHIVAQVVPAKKFRTPDGRFRDDEIMVDSRNKYSSLGFPLQPKRRSRRNQSLRLGERTLITRPGV